jgi:hypothetical protein
LALWSDAQSSGEQGHLGAQSTSASAEPALLARPIESIEVGQRVAVDVTAEQYAAALEHAGVHAWDGDEIDAATWRKIVLRAPKVDGTHADVTLLRPLSWLEDRDARVGGSVELSVPECGIDGRATVLAIEGCPAIEASLPGTAVVTGTFRHESAEIVNLFVEGQAEPISTTAHHVFWSDDRADFVCVTGLRSGERLCGTTSPAVVSRVVSTNRRRPVYNLEVQGAHVFRVGQGGFIVHNSSAARPPQGRPIVPQGGGNPFAGGVPPNLRPKPPPIVYRTGRPTPSNLTPRPQDAGGLSVRDSLSNPVKPGTAGPLDGRPVFPPGADYTAIDTSKLPPGSVIIDNQPPGHGVIQGVPPQVIKDAVIPKPGSGKLP